MCEHALARIDAHNPRLNAFLAVARDRALERARAIDRDKHAGPLAGVPIALKDNIMTRGITTTASSKMLRHFVPPYDATVVGRLEAAGAVVMGKTNCDEFAMGSSTENSAFGPSRNPWNPDHISGGSSGGSAVAVAAGFSPIALGSDTGGSIRQPASLCGIVGLKPTYGRVSRYGLIAFASSLDQIGPMARTAYDAAIALSVLAGADPYDSTASQEPPADYVGALTGDIRGVRLGVPRKMLEQGVDNAVRDCFYGALDILRARGAELVDIELPHAPYAISTYYVVATAEASSNLARYDGVRYGFRAEGARDLTRDVRENAEPGVRPRSEAPHHARHLRAERRLLRCVLPEGAAGAHARAPRLRPRVRTASMPSSCRPARRRRSRIGEKSRGSAVALSDGRVHGQRESRGASRAERAMRADAEQAADRTAADRQAVRRSDVVEGWRQLRAGHELVESVPAI